MPGLLERLAEVSSSRSARGAARPGRRARAGRVCGAGRATSLIAVGEWIVDAPPQVMERLGVRPDPVLPRRLLARIDGDALDP